MLLSFSHAAMLPMIEAGLASDEDGVRVKRQTIRRMGPRGQALLKHDPLGHTIPYDLHLWWKSRTAEKRLIGIVACPRIKVWPIHISRFVAEQLDGTTLPVLKVVISWGANRADHVFYHTIGGLGLGGITRIAHADGFDSAEAFGDYFVPNTGDVFDGILYKWSAPA